MYFGIIIYDAVEIAVAFIVEKIQKETGSLDNE